MIQTEIIYKPQAPIIIYSIFGIEKYSHDDIWYEEVDKEIKYFQIIGELFYCGLLLDGRLIISEIDLNIIIKKINLRINLIENGIIYFKELSNHSINILNKLNFEAKHINTIYEEDNDDEEEEEYIFLKL